MSEQNGRRPLAKSEILDALFPPMEEGDTRRMFSASRPWSSQGELPIRPDVAERINDSCILEATDGGRITEGAVIEGSCVEHEGEVTALGLLLSGHWREVRRERATSHVEQVDNERGSPGEVAGASG